MQVQASANAPVVQTDATPDQAALALANAQVDQVIQARVQAGTDGAAILNLLGNTFRMPPSLDLPIGQQLILRVLENADGKLQLDIFTPSGKGATSSQKSGDSALAPELGNYEATVELEIPAVDIVSRKASASDAQWQALKDEEYTPTQQLAQGETPAESELFVDPRAPQSQSQPRQTSAPAQNPADPRAAAQLANNPAAPVPLPNSARNPAATAPSNAPDAPELTNVQRDPQAQAQLAQSAPPPQARVPAAIAERLDLYQAFARDASDATAAGELPAVMQRKVELELNLPAESAPIAAALARTGLPVTEENVVHIRQALALGEARSAETLAWLHAAQLEGTPEHTAALDSMLAPGSEKLGALLAKSAPETAENLGPLLLNPQHPPAEVASVLREVLSHLAHAEASASNAAAEAVKLPLVERADGTLTTADPHLAEVATNLRGQLLLPAVQARTDAPQQGLYLQMPVQAQDGWRTMELKITKRPSGQRELPEITDISVRLDTAAFGPVDARLTALGRNVALAFTFQHAAALQTFQSAQDELRAGLAEQNVACGAIVCRVAGSLPALTHDGPLSLDRRG